MLLEMARCLQHRGADSAGVAVFGPRSAPHLQMAFPEVWTESDLDALPPSALVRLGTARREAGGLDFPVFPPTRENGATNTLADLDLVKSLESAYPGATVSGLGARMSIYKTVGRIDGLAGRLEGLHGSHGIAHLRLATESRIDPAHAQPFWGRPYYDLAVTHNGHITNYARLRAGFEARGFSFASHNDSEIIGVYLGDLMERGHSFAEALERAGQELDGSFSFIAASADALGVARDPIATKPLLYVENEAGVTLASEPRALYHVCGESAKIREIKPKETKTWALD